MNKEEMQIPDVVYIDTPISKQKIIRKTIKEIANAKDLLNSKYIIPQKNYNMAIAYGLAYHNILTKENTGLDFKSSKDYILKAPKKLKQKRLENICNAIFNDKSITEKFNLSIALFEYEKMTGEFIISELINKHKGFLIYVAIIENQYCFLTNPTAISKKDNFCELCLTFYNRGQKCLCTNPCPACKTRTCEGKTENIAAVKQKVHTLQSYLPPELLNIIRLMLDISTECKDCNNNFYSVSCFNKHINTCLNNVRCSKCFKKYDSTKIQHDCRLQQCNNCSKYVVISKHKCYIQPLIDDGKYKKESKLIYYDYECYVNGEQHIPFLIIACYSNSSRYECFLTDEHNNANDNFCKWLFQQDHKYATAMAHNSKGYDIHFIRQWLHENNQTIEHPIFRGNKLLYMRASNFKLRFLDSSAFVQAPLSSFPATFGLSIGGKGYFPYSYVNTNNINDPLCSVPKKEFSIPYDMLSNEERFKEFDIWYNTLKDTPDKTILDHAIEYCKQDVHILQQGMNSFRKSFTIDGLDPFKSITIAGACMKIFKHSYLSDKIIAIDCMTRKQNQSAKEKAWLATIEYNQKITLQRQYELKLVLKSGKNRKKNTTFYIDGFHEQSRTCYEFLGCYYHGCPTHFPDGINKKLQRPFQDLHNRIQSKIRHLEEAGYKVEICWECQTEQYNMALVDRHTEINMRDALFGGISEAIYNRYICSNREKIYYIDYTSLYPTIMWGEARGITPSTKNDIDYFHYPIGHPEYVASLKGDIENDLLKGKYYGFWKGKIIAPKKLFQPLLLKGAFHKRYRASCYSCIKSQDKECQHTDEEKCFIATYTTIEVQKALQLGYKIIETYAILNFPDTFSVWDDVNEDYQLSIQSRSIFKDYVAHFFAMKTEASGFPPHCRTNEDKIKYVEDFAKTYNLRLNKNNIKKNKVARAVAKLALNSLWGKFGMREDMRKHKELNLTLTKNLKEFKEMKKTMEIYNISMITENIVQVEYKSDLDEQILDVSVPIASFTTAHARLRLYKAMELINHDVLYMDTDSLIYVVKQDKNPIVLGDNLGDFTNELQTDEYIEEFYSSGVKSYAYKTNKGTISIKNKGIRMNDESSSILGFEAFKKCALDKKPIENIPQTLFKIDKQSSSISTRENYTKTMSYTLTKRQTKDQDYKTYPYGY